MEATTAVSPLPFSVDEPATAAAIRRERKMAKLIASGGPLSRFAFKVCDKVLSYRELANKYAAIDKLQKSAANGRDETGYKSEAEELTAAINYKKEIDAGLTATSFSTLLYERQQIMFRELIVREPSIDAFLNFGVSYGYIDDILARTVPSIQFHAVDRSPLTKLFNESVLPARPNLKFHAADIFDFLSTHPAKNGILFHARTATYIPKAALTRLYEAAKANGYRCVLGYEPFGLSRSTAQPFEFSTKDAESVAYLFDMMIHNYPAILAHADYKLSNLQVLQIEHSNPDHRVLEFCARLSS